MRWVLLVILIQFYAIGYSQKAKLYTKEISFTNENDVYLLKFKDGYYTNGFFLRFAKAVNKNNQKIIRRYEIGQTMFNVRERRLVWRGEEPFDRPYAGYLFAKATTDKFLNNGSILSYKVEVGVTGDLALTRQLQDWYHKRLGLFDYPFWERQIPNSIGVTAGIKYATTVTAKKANQSNFKIVPTAEANMGNFFMNAKAGAYFCFGKFEATENSILLNANISTTEYKPKRNYELIFYCYPQILLQGYNATLQGNLFAKSLPENVFTASPKAVVLQNTFGAVYAKNRLSTRAEVVYLTKEAASQLQGHSYIGLHAAYRF
jgi:lipid A 3-O-deacylase